VYGEERFAGRIAAAVVRERSREPFTRSGRLVELLYDQIPAPARRTGGHTAKRTFQALRMEVNDELGVLRRAVPAAIDALAVGGRVVVESYHSLEDRLVKQAFTAVTRVDVPPDLPVVPEDRQPALRLVTRGAERAGDDEIAHNPRAASVRLRAVERIRPSTTTGKGAA
jgi:16S rRNA (cytosine1402-N4)-methyltransferase